MPVLYAIWSGNFFNTWVIIEFGMMDTTKKVEAIQNPNLLEGLSENEMQLLAEHARELELSKNEVVYCVGNHADRVYLVKKGRIKICTDSGDSKEVLKNLVHAGELFGEGAIFAETTRKDYASAMDEGVIVLGTSPASVSLGRGLISR